MGRNIFFHITVITALFLASVFPLGLVAQTPGDLMVAPTRVVLEGRDRSAVINLVNRGQTEATYRVALKNMTMNEEGAYEDITEPNNGEQFADDMIRFSPRQVTLKPGEVQKVRVMVRKPAGLEEGEYRSHMLFRGLPPKDIGEDIEAIEFQEGEVAVKLIPIFGVSIPIIVRHGNVSSQVAISDINILDPEPDAEEQVKQVSLSINREGTASAYGDLTVFYTPEGTSKAYSVGLLKGVSVLHPYPRRLVKVPIKEDEVVLGKGQLAIRYHKTKEKGGELLTQGKYQLP